MYPLLSLLCGIIVAIMVVFNGDLSNHYGLYTSNVFIHASGLVLITAAALLNRENPFAKNQKWYLYLGGVMGILTIIFNNFAYARISVSAILALTLLGQSVTGLIVDQTGWMGAPRRPFNKFRILSLLLITAGIAAMVDRFELLALLFSLATGVNIVVSRTINARLADRTSVCVSTFFNYVFGLLFSIPVLLILGGKRLKPRKNFIAFLWLCQQFRDSRNIVGMPVAEQIGV
jgi:transporter family-2 protein